MYGRCSALADAHNMSHIPALMKNTDSHVVIHSVNVYRKAMLHLHGNEQEFAYG